MISPLAKTFFTWLLIFIGISLILQSFRPADEQKDVVQDDVVLQTTDDSYSLGEGVIVEVRNNLDRTIRVSSDCPAEPLKVEQYKNGIWKPLLAPQGKYFSCERDSAFFEFAPNTPVSIDFSPWKDELFSEIGRYRLTLEVMIDDIAKSFSTEFEVAERGFFSSVVYHAFFRPIFNFLLFLTSVLPGFSFGLAIIVLTILIRLILLVPNQKALKSQKAMMRLQPELEDIKRKYKGDQQKISQETLALWKRHKVTPLGGCLPILLQLPILIALFYVIKDGFSPYQGYIIYDFLSISVDLTRVNTDFFGLLDLHQINATWLPLLAGGLQFFQMKMALAHKRPEHHQDEKKSETSGAPLQDSLKMMNKTMIYFMPIMIALMVASLPSGVGLYLTVSTVFGIAQQYFVNKGDVVVG